MSKSISSLKHQFIGLRNVVIGLFYILKKVGYFLTLLKKNDFSWQNLSININHYTFNKLLQFRKIKVTLTYPAQRNMSKRLLNKQYNLIYHPRSIKVFYSRDLTTDSCCHCHPDQQLIL